MEHKQLDVVDYKQQDDEIDFFLRWRSSGVG